MVIVHLVFHGPCAVGDGVLWLTPCKRRRSRAQLGDCRSQWHEPRRGSVVATPYQAVSCALRYTLLNRVASGTGISMTTPLCSVFISYRPTHIASLKEPTPCPSLKGRENNVAGGGYSRLDDLPQPTLSEAHILWVAISKLRSGCASACMELTTISHLRWRWNQTWGAPETGEMRGYLEQCRRFCGLLSPSCAPAAPPLAWS